MLLEDLCFDAQQASEKALKALFVLKGATVPRTHSIADLLTALTALGFDIPDQIQSAASLTDYIDPNEPDLEAYRQLFDRVRDLPAPNPTHGPAPPP